jgi:hypothetical protein
MTTRNFTQYVKRGAGYCAIGSTVAVLAPGFYDVGLVDGKAVVVEAVVVERRVDA